MRSVVVLLLLAGCEGKAEEWANQVSSGISGGSANSAQPTGDATTPAKEGGATKSADPTFDPAASFSPSPSQLLEDPNEVRHLTSSECNSLTDGGKVNGPDCVTADIKCGETIKSHTRGGTKRFDTKFYEKNYCWPGTVNRNGGDERVYRFIVDEQKDKAPYMVKASLDSPCADLEVTMMRGMSATSCPTSSEICDTSNKRGRTHASVKERVDPEEVWYVLVEGADESEGAFALTLECGGN